MQIGGLEKLTLIDYPGKIACTVFLIGCNFRCPFCYSSELVLPEKIKKQPIISEKEFFAFLKQRKSLLEGVVICGGEPTIHKDLPVFIKKIKKLGFLVKLDTNGSNPEMLKMLISKRLVDYVAMDVKAPKEKYERLTGVPIDLKKIEKSIEMISEHAPAYEFRTTFVPELLTKEDIVEIAHWLRGAELYYLQQFKIMSSLLSEELETVTPYPKEYLEETLAAIKPCFKHCFVRGL